jgi:hypothetical protein
MGIAIGAALDLDQERVAAGIELSNAFDTISLWQIGSGATVAAVPELLQAAATNGLVTAPH